MRFPSLLYMSPHGLKWQPKSLARPRRRPPRPVTAPSTPIKGVQFAPRVLIVNELNHCQRSHKGIHMYTNTRGLSAWPVLGAAIAACTLFTGGDSAHADAGTPSVSMSSQGLLVDDTDRGPRRH